MIATYGGYEVNVRSKACHYRIYVKEGVRGFNIPVTASQDTEGSWSVTTNYGKKLTVERVEVLVDVVKGIYDKSNH